MNKLYIYDCDLGQGAVKAPSIDDAKRKALSEAGSLSGVRNVREATQDDIAFRKMMGGWCG